MTWPPTQPPVFTDVLWDVSALPRLPAGVPSSATIAQPAPSVTGNIALGGAPDIPQPPAVPVLPWFTQNPLPSDVPFAINPPIVVSPIPQPLPDIIQTSTGSEPVPRPTQRPRPNPSSLGIKTTSIRPSLLSTTPISTPATRSISASTSILATPSISTTPKGPATTSIPVPTSSSRNSISYSFASSTSSSTIAPPSASSSMGSSSLIPPLPIFSSHVSSSTLSSSTTAPSSTALSSSTASSSRTSSTSVPTAGGASTAPTQTQTSSPVPSSSSSDARTIAIAVAVPLGILAIALLSFWLYFILRRRSQRKSESGAGGPGDAQASGYHAPGQQRDLLDLYAASDNAEAQGTGRPHNTPTPPAPASAIFGGFPGRRNRANAPLNDEKHRNLILPDMVVARKPHSRNFSNLSNISRRSLLPRRNKPSPTYPEVAYLYDPEISPPQPNPSAAPIPAPTPTSAPAMARGPSPPPPASIVNNPLQLQMPRNPTPTFNGVPIIAAPRPSRSRSQSRSSSPYPTAIPVTIPSAPLPATNSREGPASKPRIIDVAAATSSTNANVERAAERERIGHKPPMLSLRTTNLDMGGFYEPTLPNPSGFEHRDSRDVSETGDELDRLPTIRSHSPSEYGEHWDVAAGGLVPARDLSRANRNKYSRELRSFGSVVFGRHRARRGSVSNSITSSEVSEGSVSLISRSGAVKRLSRWERKGRGPMSAMPGQRDEEWRFLGGFRDSYHSM